MKKVVGIQYAALPYRIVGRQVEILLITSRETRRWVTPKGWPMKGLKPQDAAAREATEEAGVIGEIEARPIGSYRYLKRLKGDRDIAVQVILFPLRVEGQAPAWKEQGQREFCWLPYRRAAAMVAEPAFQRLIREFGRARGARVLPWARRSILRGFSRLRSLHRPAAS